MPYLRTTPDGVLLLLHVQPNAKRTELGGSHGEELKIRLHAPPVDGRANAELIQFLSETLGVPRARLELLRGHAGRSKQVLVRGAQEAEVATRLSPRTTS